MCLPQCHAHSGALRGTGSNAGPHSVDLKCVLRAWVFKKLSHGAEAVGSGIALWVRRTWKQENLEVYLRWWDVNTTGFLKDVRLYPTLATVRFLQFDLGIATPSAWCIGTHTGAMWLMHVNGKQMLDENQGRHCLDNKEYGKKPKWDLTNIGESWGKMTLEKYLCLFTWREYAISLLS